ncbi:unnamed protein product [Urochloa decumbens]|uniref:C2 domain-containing protein n=1 Tax=Urochloa decumbens TaxID=240449 RepID=A0ABC9D8R8_9POAL
MAYRELELTLLSAQGLKNVNLITRMDVYAVVTISSDPLTRQCTPSDPSGGRNPCWNATLRFAVPPTAAEAAGACLHVLLRAERVLGDRDVGEVIIPLADLLAAAPAPTAAAPQQQPQLASYQVRKLHRWEPRGVLNVAYRLGPVVAPVVEPPWEKPPPATAAAVAYAVGVPASQQPPPPPRAAAKQFQPQVDAYSPPPRRPAVEREEARAPSPAPAARNDGKSSSNGGIGREGPTQVCVGPHTQIILGGGPAATTMSPTGGSSNVSPRKMPDGYGSWPKQSLHHHGVDTTTAHVVSSAQSMFSPRKEDRSRPKVFSESQHDTQAIATLKEAEAVSPRPPSRRPPVSTFSSHNSSSSLSSPPPYSPAYPFTPSPSSSAHSFASSPHSSAHPSTPSPRRHGQSAAVGNAFGPRTMSHTDSLRSSSSHRSAVSSPLHLHSSPLVTNHSDMVSSTPSPHPFGQPARANSHTNSPRPVSTQ